METKKILLIGSGALIGGLILIKVAKSASTPADGYSGPSVIGQPGPLVQYPASSSETSGTQQNTAVSPLDLAAFLTSEIEKTRQSAITAQQASATTTNVDLLNTFLTKVGAGGLKNQQINLGYSPTGQVTSFSLIKALDPMTELQKAQEAAKIQETKEASVIKSLKYGFNAAQDLTLNAAGQVYQAAQEYKTKVWAGKATGGAVGVVPQATKK